MNNKFLETKNITKTFGKLKALDDVNFNLYRGKIHGLLGENGAGKSSLMNVLSGIYKPEKGAVYLCLLYTSPSPRDKRQSRMPSSA